jgi:hypothetical protein
MIESKLKSDCVQLNMEHKEYYAPEYFKDKPEALLKDLLSSLQSTSMKARALYYNTAEKLGSQIKYLARQNRCYCEVKVKTKLKHYPMPRAVESGSMSSASTKEPSHSFLASTFVICRAKLPNGAIEAFIGDIAEQKVSELMIFIEFFAKLKRFRYANFRVHCRLMSL